MHDFSEHYLSPELNFFLILFTSGLRRSLCFLFHFLAKFEWVAVYMESYSVMDTSTMPPCFLFADSRVAYFQILYHSFDRLGGRPPQAL